MVLFSFFVYLMSYFLFERLKILNLVDLISAFVFSLLWLALIITVTRDLVNINKRLTKFFSNDAAAMTVAHHLSGYVKINLLFGIPCCIFQVSVYSVNIWINDDIPAALVSLGYDLSCMGVAAGYVVTIQY